MDNARKQLVDNIRIAIARMRGEEEILRTAAGLIDEFSEDFNWTGFYMLREGELHVGPYIGPETEHTRISLDRGICGAAASRKETIVVDDVRSDPRFLACSVNTRSEIVVPLLLEGECIGQIDIDSNRPANFNGNDRQMLEDIARVIVERLSRIR